MSGDVVVIETGIGRKADASGQNSNWGVAI